MNDARDNLSSTLIKSAVMFTFSGDVILNNLQYISLSQVFERYRYQNILLLNVGITPKFKY